MGSLILNSRHVEKVRNTMLPTPLSTGMVRQIQGRPGPGEPIDRAISPKRGLYPHRPRDFSTPKNPKIRGDSCCVPFPVPLD